jgi:hypothetical protein
MNRDTPQSTTPAYGLVSYMAESAESSLFRNGKVLTRRDRDGNDAGDDGIDIEELTIAIGDARTLTGASRRTIDVHGFELLDCPLARPGLDFYDHQQVVRDYYPECAAILRRATGAAHVFAFDHNIRSTSGKESRRRIAGGQQVQGPAHLVHGDYTLTSGPQRLRDLAKPPGGNDTLRSVLDDGEALLEQTMVDGALAGDGRFAIINVWRNIDDAAVESESMALCDGQTVDANDLVVFEIHYHDRIGENYFAKFAPGHGWWWYPAMARQEALLIKQWDSHGELARSGGVRSDSSVGDGRAPCSFSFHTAFKDPGAPPDARDRQSIEVRCVVVYD